MEYVGAWSPKDPVLASMERHLLRLLLRGGFS